jgi:hypothetical protein
LPIDALAANVPGQSLTAKTEKGKSEEDVLLHFYLLPFTLWLL